MTSPSSTRSPPEGLTAFLVDTDLPWRVDGTRQTDPIGLRLIPTADVVPRRTYEFPAESWMHGEPGRGMDTFFSTFNVSRLGNASELIGFGRQGVGGRAPTIAESAVQVRIRCRHRRSRAFSGFSPTATQTSTLRRWCATGLPGSPDRGDDPTFATSLAKKLAIDAAESAVNEVFALVGGHGLYTDTDFGQLLHDVKVLRIAGGSLEVLRNTIARRILGSDDLEGLQ